MLDAMSINAPGVRTQVETDDTALMLSDSLLDAHRHSLSHTPAQSQSTIDSQHSSALASVHEAHAATHTGTHAEDGEHVSTAKGARAVSPSRWWVLFVYCLFTFLQGGQWNYAGPIGPLIKSAYGVSDSIVELFLNYGPILYLACSMPFAFYMETPSGLRGSVVCGCALVFASSLVRLGCQGESQVSLACLHLSFILNAAAGPVAMAAVTKLSETWFPFHERGTATAIAAEANVLGGALSSLAGPLIVTTGTNAQFLVYNIVFIVLCGVCFLAAFVYFPSKPAIPPSASAAVRHEDAAAAPLSVKSFTLQNLALLRNGNFMLLCLACGITNGMSSAWGSTISLNSGGHISTVGAGWIGFAQSVGGNVGGIVAGWIVDRTHAHKLMLLFAFSMSGANVLWFSIITQGVLPRNCSGCTDAAVLSPQIYASAIIAAVALNCSWPVFYDLSAEEVFPVPGATSLMMMTNIYNIGALLLYFVPLDTAAAAFNWINVGTLVSFTLLLGLLYRPRRRRSRLDETQQPTK